MSICHVIRSARLLLDTKSEVINDGAVVVQDKLIIDAGPWSSIQSSISKESHIKDLGDVTLMPGLFDCHVHLQMDPSSINTSTASSLTDAELLPLMTSNASKLLDAGVTTARDLGSRGLTAITIRDQISKGEIEGPRMQVANAPITVPGGHACAMGGEAQGVEQVRAEVRKRAHEGADVIKVMATGGYMTAGSHPSKARYTVEELEAIVDEAKKFGLKVTTHATGTEGIERAADARLDSIEHCAWVVGQGTSFDEKVARKIVENDMAVCPTMNTACVEHNYFCPWDSRKAVVENLTSLRKIGAKLIVGTDAGIGLCPFERYADGLTCLRDAGYTPREILTGATLTAASVCGLSAVTGRIAAGLEADLAAFEGNPLEDIENVGKPRFVMARGKEHTLTPIAPIGEEVGEMAALTLKLLRNGAGIPDTIE